jgi:iron complex outermembrane recepter protein
MSLRSAAPATREIIVARRAVAPLVAALALGVAPLARLTAQAMTCSAAPSSAVHVAARHWPAPLDRQVTLEGDKITLRDGLARLATAARVRLSYVAELLPLDRRLCLSYRSVAAGEVLSDLLRGTELEPVVAGDDQIVLAPARRTAAVELPSDDGVDTRHTSVLDRVVVVGTPTESAERATPISVGVVTGDKLAHLQGGSLTHLLDGSVPGVWVWQQSPTTLMARYGSVRGASSFGLSYPKIYIDGIEVANPLIVQQFDPAMIERLEVIRGPQGAALYGADANSGVINITTRHDGTGPGGQRLQLASTAGVSGSQFAPQGVLTQEHALAFRTGTSERSAGLGLNLTTLGAYVPGAFARTIAANGDVRVVGSSTIFTGTARLFSERAGTPTNPLLPQFTGVPGPGAVPQRSGPANDGTSYSRSDGGETRSWTTAPGGWTSFAPDTALTQSVSQYTVGGTLAFAPNDRWSHTFVLGVDGYRLANPALGDGPIPSATDSALAAARGGGDRVTARVTSSAHFGSIESSATTLTFTAEHAAVREQSTIAATTISPAGTSTGRLGEPTTSTEAQAQLVGWHGNSGLVAQANTSLRNRLFLTAGLRLERDAALVGSTRVSSLPMLGGALVGDRGDVTLKVRAAYGKGVRPVQGAIRELAWSGRQAALVAYDLEPEQQAGVEAGADLFVGRTLGFHVTRFDQRATGLIQSVAVMVPDRSASRDARFDENGTDSHVAYELQNVGAIGNRGWEMESNAELGRLSLAASLSLVDSRVQRVASGYTGDLQAGDRMLEVPARTTSLSGSWHGNGWFSSLTLSRAADWTGYDRVAVADALTSGGLTPGELVGAKLRGYWREYNGVTRLRASFSRDLFHGLSLTVSGDNLLGQQRGEPDNATVVPGRTITAGLKAKF